MTKVKLAKKVLESCLRDKEGNPCYCKIPVIVDNNEKVAEVNSQFENCKPLNEAYYCMGFKKVPCDIELAVKDKEAPIAGIDVYEIISDIKYQDSLLNKIPCYLPKNDSWEIVE